MYIAFFYAQQLDPMDAVLRCAMSLFFNIPEQKWMHKSPYFRVYCMWQQANCLEGRSFVCIFFMRASALTQTLRGADRSVTRQKHWALPKPASSASRAGATLKMGRLTEKKYNPKTETSLQNCPSLSQHLSFFPYFTFFSQPCSHFVLLWSNE